MTQDVSMLEFVKAVFRVEWADIPPEPCREASGCYEVSSSDIRQFLGTHKGVDAYDGICHVSSALSSQVHDSVDENEGNTVAEERRKQIMRRCAQRLGRPVPVRTYQAKVRSRAAEATGDYHLGEKPDLTFGVEETRKPNFKWTMVPIEVEKTRGMSAGQLTDVLLKEKSEVFVVMVCSPLP